MLDAIRRCASKLGRNPTLRELRRMSGVKETRLYHEFGNLSRALKAAGMKPGGSGFEIGTRELFLDWGRLARKLSKLPTIAEYTLEGRFSHGPFLTRFGHWRRVAEEFRKFVHEEKIEKEWGDVLAMKPERLSQVDKDLERLGRAGEAQSKKALQAGNKNGKRKRKTFVLEDRPVYGPPLPRLLPALAHEPINENGVIYLFGLLAERLGFVVERLQAEFPDCEAMREMEKGRWQRVAIEFEYESRSFVKHQHPVAGCDVIVCWVHNWPECPERLEVIELSRVIKRM